MHAAWAVEIGRPEGPGWIAGDHLRDARRGPFNELLLRIGERARTRDRRTIAASFALRFGWSSAMAIAPYVRDRFVPDIGLDNVSFKFTASTSFERAAIHVLRGVAPDGGDEHALLRTLRRALTSQAEPIVDALFAWSGFAKRGTWGMLTSSWASQFTDLAADPNDQRDIQPLIESLFAGDDVVAAMQPRMQAVTCGSSTHLYQRRASCCRYYLLPAGELCASCPLVSDQERLARNRAWMRAHG